MAHLGDPSTQPEEECFIPTPHATEVELKEWESTAVITWVARAPASTTPKEAEAIFMEELHLREGEVVVSRHHPEAFIIKFAHQRHCVEALKRGSVKRRGIELHFVKWRGLKSALGVALMFRATPGTRTPSSALWHAPALWRASRQASSTRRTRAGSVCGRGRET
ncbi:hypothetical protein OsJ_13709 [Oryza sativa Japonica Group]|uniref:Uncharacterized protein n=1 Tax=Oryza sativa subsp. japonica TaxID=39947 RepID=B9FDJ2_ORYSJ|nr:hypothetical protein OsJ_13709 [Oryza sativa Japonica Group]